MARILWDQLGSRFYEAGVDRGVLYTTDGSGVPWNGLTSVTESPSGGEVTPYYLDGVKYLNIVGLEEFGGTIEAYTYPDEFEIHDGTYTTGGVSFHQQKRKPFGLSYRTGVGNDLDGANHGYKIHIVYNALASPSESGYSSLSNDPEAMTFSWAFTTTPTSVPFNSDSAVKILPMSHVVVDSRKINNAQLRRIEDYLYGNGSDVARLPTLSQILAWLVDPPLAYRMASSSSGETTLTETTMDNADLIGWPDEGVYSTGPNTRLVETHKSGLYILE